MPEPNVLASFLIVAGTVFVAELTDKDALFILSLATRESPRLTFAAGSVAFTITSAIIVLAGSVLVAVVPVAWVKVAGGAIMLGYAAYVWIAGAKRNEGSEGRGGQGGGRSGLVRWLLAMVVPLIVLDLAGDATEIIIVVFVAQLRNIALVFSGAVVALVAASAVETVLGSRLGRLLSPSRIRYLSVVVFAAIGAATILTTAF